MFGFLSVVLHGFGLEIAQHELLTTRVTTRTSVRLVMERLSEHPAYHFETSRDGSLIPPSYLTQNFPYDFVFYDPTRSKKRKEVGNLR